MKWIELNGKIINNAMHLYQTYLVGMQQKQPQLLQEDTIVSYLNEQIDAKQMSSHKKYVDL